MIIDLNGTILTPGNLGRNCMGNGLHPNVECCCDECDYMLCCLDTHTSDLCAICKDPFCPHSHIQSGLRK